MNPTSVALQAAALALFLVGTAFAAAQPASEVASGWIDHAPARSKRWMIAAATPLAVDAGYAMLAKGGSAVDAAIAAQLVLGLVEPQSSGLGGGAFMLVHDARRGRLLAYDGRETAPAAARSDRFIGRDGRPLPFHQAVVGGRSVGVPGVPRLIQLAHRQHGKLPWASLFAPAIALAENGFAVSPRLHALIASERHFVQPRIRGYFLDATGAPLAVGHILRNPAYAATLRTLAAGGADAFYAGAIAEDVVATANGFAQNPGDLTLLDLAGYRARERRPLCGGYRGYRVCGMPPPSSGGITLLQVLAMLEPYDLRAMRAQSMWSVHFIGEAERLAYADRDVYIADPDFVDVPSGLLDAKYLARRAALIRSDSVFENAEAGDPPRDVHEPRDRPSGRGAAAEFPSTSQIVVVDGDGDAVSMTTTIEDQFGSRLMTAGGFLLNNELTDFSFVASDESGRPVANRVEANKRPRSTMAPTIVYDRAGGVFMLTGSPGGASIVNYVAKTLIGVIDWQLDPQAAVSLGNFGSRNGPTELEAETPVAAVAPKLRAMGYDVRVGHETSGLQAIVRTRNGWIGGTDPRREGVVRGR